MTSDCSCTDFRRLAASCCVLGFALAILLVAVPQAQAQAVHGITVQKGCTSPRFVGQTNDCIIVITSAEDLPLGAQDSVTITAVQDAIDPTGFNQIINLTAVETVGAGASCAVGPVLPCTLNPAADGQIILRSNTRTILATDPDPLNDQATVTWQDNCDGPAGQQGCDPNQINMNEAPASTVIQTCEVMIDKQVSCDAGNTFVDIKDGDDAANGSVNGCIAEVGDTVAQQILVMNTGDAAVTCDVQEDGGTVSAGLTVASMSTSDPIDVTAGGGLCEENDGKDTGSLINCFCLDGDQNQFDITPPQQDAEDRAQIECCGVDIDKILTCQMPFGGGGAVDADDNGFTIDNGEGTGSCDAELNSAIGISDTYRNIGTIGLLDCDFTDTQNNGGMAILCQDGGALPNDGQNLPNNGDTFVPTCEDATCDETFDMGEPDTARVDCDCDDSAFDEGQAISSPGNVTAFDEANANCINADVEITKTCVPAGNGEHTITVDIENTGDAALTGCIVTDILVKDEVDAGSNGVNCAELTGIMPGPDDETMDITATLGCTDMDPTVGGGPVEICNSTIDLGNTFNSCNTATVSCTVAGTAETVEDDARADCEEVPGGCFTRTPGYWATHPWSVDQVLNGNTGEGGTLDGAGGSITSCGLPLTSAFGPNGNNDAPFTYPEDLCSIGRDKKAVNTSPQQMQLIRQCAAASLNIQVSLDGGLDCDGAFAGIAGVFNACCTDLCPSGAAPDAINQEDQTINGVSMLSCIGALDMFNNADFDDDDFSDVGLLNHSANPGECQDAHNNRRVNDKNEDDGRVYGPKK